jgi:NTE family protein
MSSVKPRVGLVLGGGYAWGLSHIGVLEALENAGIPIDLIAGTSMGSVIGALYARELDAAVIKQQATQLDWVGILKLIDPVLPRSGLMTGKRITNLLKRFMGDVDFKDLGIPFSCVATDIISGDAVVINQGSVLEAVRASISIPVIFTVLKKDGRFLVDGGLVNNIPVDVVRQMGADYVIAVDCTPTKAERAENLLKQVEVKEPRVLQVMVQSIYITTHQASCQMADTAEIVIHPKLAGINPADFHKARECILAGEIAATDIVAHIKRDLADFKVIGAR